MYSSTGMHQTTDRHIHEAESGATPRAPNNVDKPLYVPSDSCIEVGSRRYSIVTIEGPRLLPRYDFLPLGANWHLRSRHHYVLYDYLPRLALRAEVPQTNDALHHKIETTTASGVFWET